MAQSTTEEGIRAVLRGDYGAAARILRPLAEDVERPDPVAQFFLAVLFETGQGVRPDRDRACRLFLQSASRANPPSWTLVWQMSEVVDDQWIPVRHEMLAVVDGSTRPESNEATTRVRLRVNDRGEAELEMQGDTSPRTEVIPWRGSR